MPAWIGDIPMLNILVLRSIKLECLIPIQIRYLQKLQILYLGMNHLSRSIPMNANFTRSKLSIMENDDFKRSTSIDLIYGKYHTNVVNLMEKGHKWAEIFTNL